MHRYILPLLMLGLIGISRAQDTLLIKAYEQLNYDQNGVVALSISGPDSLSAAQFDLVFNPSMVNYTGIMGMEPPAGFDLATNPIGEDRIRFILYSNSGAHFSPVGDTLVSLGFHTGTEPGPQIWSLTDITLGDTEGMWTPSIAIDAISTILGPKLTYPESTLNLGEVPWFGTGNASASVGNVGNDTLVVSAIHLAPPFSSTAPLPISIAPGNTFDLPIILDTSEPLEGQGSLSLTTSDPDPIRALQSIELLATVYAVNELHVGQGSGVLGAPITLPVSANNQLPFSGFQFDLQLPQGTGYVDGTATLSDRSSDHLVTANTLADGTLRILGYSPSNTPFSGTEGVLVEVDLIATEDFNSAQVGISGATMSSPGGADILSDTYPGQLNLTYPVFVASTSNIAAGDLATGTTHFYDVSLYNAGNAPLYVSGVNSTSSYLASTLPIPLTLAPGSSISFDIIYEAQTLGSIDETLTFFHNGSPSSNSIAFTATTSAANYLVHGDTTSIQDSTWALPLHLVANEGITGIQCDITVPDGISLDINSMELTSDLSAFGLATSTLGDEIYRLLIYSFTGAQIPAGTTEVVTFSGTIESNTTAGDYSLGLDGVILSNADGQNVASVPFSSGTLTVITAVQGCTDVTACNFNASANTDDGSCVYASGCETCSGPIDGTGTIVDNDSDDDGVCDADEIAGCQDDTACNYNAAATDSDDSCVYVDGICDTCVDGAIVDNDSDNDGVCDADEVAGCQDDTACNFNALATDSDDSCVYVDGICDTCVDGIIVDNDADNDGVCDADEVAGCQDDTACNFNPLATDSDDSCIYVDGICDTCVDGAIVDNDSDNDGVCDSDESPPCPADLNQDDLIGAADLLVLLGYFGCGNDCANGDVNDDGIVAIDDVLILLSLYGSTCPQ